MQHNLSTKGTIIILLFTTMLVLTPATRLLAQECSSDETWSEIDFWLGDWEVFSTRTGEFAGTNVIEKILDNCAYFEQWIGDDGYNGTSMTYIDPATGNWAQIWVDNAGGSQFYWNGVLENSTLRFQYETVDANNHEVEGRMLIIRLSATGVRQVNQISNDGGTNWQTLYDLTYIRLN